VGIGDVYRGHAGIRNYMEAVNEAFEDYRPEVEQLIDAGNQVLTLAIEHGKGRGSGAEVQANKTAHLWTCGRARRFGLISTSVGTRPSKPLGWNSKRCPQTSMLGGRSAVHGIVAAAAARECSA
jgi:hypothetical protein